jgi:hypothetical protein
MSTVVNSIESDLSRFTQDGFGVVRQLLSQEEVSQIRDGFMRLNADGPIPGLSEIRGGTGDYTPDDPLAFYPRMMMPHLHDELEVGPLSLRYMIDRRFHPYLRAFLGEEPVAVQTMFYFKPPGARGQELHQDNFYLRVKPGTCAAAWIAVDDADFENGGMKLVPGSNDYQIVCPERADAATSFTTDYVRPPEGLSAQHVDLKAGDVLFFNGSIIHGSSPNSSATRFRRSLIAHYIPLGSVVGGHYAQKPRLFDGSIVEVEETEDAGPCGTMQPMGRH